MYYYQAAKIVLALFLFCLLGQISVSKAQTVKFGVSGGMNLSTHIKEFRYSSPDVNLLEFTPNLATGYQAGVLGRFVVSPSFRIQTEPSIILLGARYDESFTVQNVEFQTDSRTKLLYFQLPLIMQLTTVPDQRTVYGRQFPTTTYHLSGGFFAGYLLEARFSGTNTGQPLGIPFEGDFSNIITSQYSSYDGGLLLGVGLEHGVDSKIGFETRASFSIFESGDTPEFWFKPQNMAVTFSVYFLI